MTAPAQLFAPHQALAAQLLPIATGDAAHDVTHILRVWRNVEQISATEGGDQSVLIAATLLHDCVAVAKSSPLRSSASRLAAAKAKDVLSGMGWGASQVAQVAHAIEAHSFSAGVAPMSCEARILQDADRLDAIGHIGIARCFHVSGQMDRAIYDLSDPMAQTRSPDDQSFAIDHFYTKLLKLSEGFQTTAGREMAIERHNRMRVFLDGFFEEIGAGGLEHGP